MEKVRKEGRYELMTPTVNRCDTNCKQVWLNCCGNTKALHTTGYKLTALQQDAS